MGKRHRRTHPDQWTSVRVAGHDWPVLDRLTIGRRTYLILQKMGNISRERYMAFDPYAGPEGDLKAILVLPRSAASEQHIRVLKPLSARNNNLPTILEYQVQGDSLFVVMNWVRGVDLQTYLEDVRAGTEPRISATEAFRLAWRLAHGICQFYRRHTVVHGDIKPANLILTGDPSRLVLIDFGSAWTAERTTRRDIGDGISPGYAAPEVQSDSQAGGFRSDQFSLSVVLYELLTLQLPYDGLGGRAGRPDAAAEMSQTLIPPSQLSPDRGRLPDDIWEGIDRITMTGLDFDPNRRYPTCPAWLEQLDRVRALIMLGPRSPLTPVNSRLTQVVAWFAEKLRRRLSRLRFFSGVPSLLPAHGRAPSRTCRRRCRDTAVGRHPS